MSLNLLDKLERESISLASFSKRAWAFFIDEILISVLFFVIYYEQFSLAQTYEAVMVLASNLLFQMIALKVIYHAFFIWYYGATVGMMLNKIICVNVDILDKPDLSASILRSVVRVFSESCFYLGFVWAFGNHERQTWQDKVAKTVVVNVS
ncbi:RDD family protein [Campylobacter sp. faydin G-140]|uniref:RDD family protein n=1 Tax=Campylobacter anatolicus TaxID=2829105 RepID=UPI001B94CF47|nr:RDD family protein [Campylobacter anatolicus]MBR8465586.1 RDD family protein [Campylobacter anatolicus]